MAIWGIILAAGAGARLAAAGLGKKQFLDWRDRPLFWHSVRAFARAPRVAGLALVFPAEELEAMSARTAELIRVEPQGLPIACVSGGERRQDSVRQGLAALPPECRHVLIHDAARPFASPALIHRLIMALDEGEQAVIPAVAVKDTIKRSRDVDGREIVAATLPRAELRAVQTPQAFDVAALREAFDRAEDLNMSVTDDASLIEAAGGEVRIVEGEDGNLKITTPEDLRLLGQEPDQDRLPPPRPVIGHGYDVHRFAADAPGRPLRLGGVAIPNAPQVVAHSDGDVLLHALTDALLGCLAEGDIGRLFPDSDPAFDNIDSAVLLNEVLLKGQRRGLIISHVDLTVVAQVPKVAPHREEIKRNVAALLRLSAGQVNVKATTEEGLGFTGEKLGLKAVAVVVGSLPVAPGA